MVEAKKVSKVRTVCLDPAEPLAREYANSHADEIVTVQDVGMSLYQMVSTGTVGLMPSSTNYNYLGMEDDEEAHEAPDYMKLNQADIVEKGNYVESFIEDPRNYEKKEQSQEGKKTDDSKGSDEKKANEPPKGGE